MQQEQTEVGRVGARRVGDNDPEESQPLRNTSELRAAVVREFKKIEKIEEEIAERRQDVKEAVRRLVNKGLNRRAVNMALARRKLVAKGGLEPVDESLMVICGVRSLGIQGELFQEADEPLEAS